MWLCVAVAVALAVAGAVALAVTVTVGFIVFVATIHIRQESQLSVV